MKNSNIPEFPVGAVDVRLSLSTLATGWLDALLDKSPGVRIVRVEHRDAGEGTLLDLAMKDPDTRRVVVELANKAFFVYSCRDGATSFVHYNHIGSLWQRVREGEFKIDERGLVYSLTEPLAGLSPTRLVVVFSAMAKYIRGPYLMRHFEQNFATLQKYLPPGTAVLRIADFGGVVGGYYMNSHGLPENEVNVQSLIRDVVTTLGLEDDDVVLYGPSKGGSAALYHGMLGGFRVVATDPIVADEHYVRFHNDSHFTVGVFPADKKDKFQELSASLVADNVPPVAIICSDRSPQFPYITTVLQEPVQNRVAFFNSRHVDIKTHPDVLLKTLNLTVMLLSMMLYKIPLAPGMRIVDEVLHREDLGSRAI